MNLYALCIYRFPIIMLASPTSCKAGCDVTCNSALFSFLRKAEDSFSVFSGVLRPVCAMSGSLRAPLLGLLTLQVCLQYVAGGAAVQVTTSNYNELRVTNDILLLNFYADWCRFSQQLKPIFEKAADAMATEDTAGTTVLFGKVDCDSEKALCANPFHVSKYPTMKLVRYGEVARKEYRGK
ncbi:Endoplasmic reticulum resident protein 44, partial [Geodia barretti]